MRLQEKIETYRSQLERGGSYSSLRAKFSREGRYKNKIKSTSKEIQTLQNRIDDIDIQIDELKFQLP